MDDTNMNEANNCAFEAATLLTKNLRNVIKFHNTTLKKSPLVQHLKNIFLSNADVIHGAPEQYIIHDTTHLNPCRSERQKATVGMLALADEKVARSMAVSIYPAEEGDKLDTQFVFSDFAENGKIKKTRIIDGDNGYRLDSDTPLKVAWGPQRIADDVLYALMCTKDLSFAKAIQGYENNKLHNTPYVIDHKPDGIA